MHEGCLNKSIKPCRICDGDQDQEEIDAEDQGQEEVEAEDERSSRSH